MSSQLARTLTTLALVLSLLSGTFVAAAPRQGQTQTPQQPATPLLMAGAQGLAPPLSTNQMEMQHEEHQQKPAGKGAQQPAEHKHEHEQPKKEEKK